MKYSRKSARLVIVSIIVTLAILLPLAWSKLANAGSTTAEPRGTFSQPNAAHPDANAALEPSLFFATYTVDNLGDTGAGSGTTGDLRYCITQANAVGGTNTISFSVTGTINLSSALPVITHDLTINGTGANSLTISGNNAVRVFATGFGASAVTFSNLTIANGNASSDNNFGGGIYHAISGTLNITNCVVRNCVALVGGGIFNQGLGTVNITNSAINNNATSGSNGGGLFNNIGGTINVNGSTFYNNNTNVAGSGAGIFNNDNSASHINLTNSTFSNNSSPFGVGGGFYSGHGAITVTNCTFTNNTAFNGGGIGKNFGTLQIKNSLIAQNNASSGADLNGAITSLGYNLIGNNSSVTATFPAGLPNANNDYVGSSAAPLNAQLAPLADNGGATQTYALLGNSLAIDHGSAATGVTTDQRGFARPFNDPGIAPSAGGNDSDIGAFELQTAAPPVLGNYANATIALSANATITPDAAPALTASISVATSTSFKGTLTASPSTGVVRVTNAHPAGIYSVTVKAFNSGIMISKTFTLTVQSGTPCTDPLAFANAPDVAINSFPTSVVLGDFNEDGKQDFVTGYDSPSPVSLRFGDGAGGFTGTTTISAAPYVRSIAVGDFNEDGHQDLALSNNSGVRSVSIRLGDGAGNFSGTADIAVGAVPASVALGDFNGDGHQDFATANSIDNTVSIRLGDGAGNFSGATEIAVGGRPESIALGDFNGDGKLDFATVANASNTVTIRLGDGAGGFTNGADVTVNAAPRFVLVGDFNGDNKQDLAVSHDSVNSIAIRLGNGSGGFTSTPDVNVSSGPRCIALGDFNNDGRQDFVTANIGFGTLSLRLGDGAGNFTGFTATSEITVGVNPVFVAAGDFNSDGRQDFAVVHFTDANLAAIRLNNSCPPPNTPPTITAAAALARQQAAAAINSSIATVNDVDQTENTLTVTATPLSGTGVTVTNLSVAANGNVTADVAAACAATNSTFTLTVTDNQNATATATLTVNVTLETTPPTLTCPANITQSTGANLCTAVVSYSTPTGSDNCGTPSVTCTPASGATFAKGVTTVTCTATDAVGNTASCNFTVTVNDAQAPTIACPANITQSTDANLCTAVVSYATPVASDNCSAVGAVSCSPSSGSAFAKGTTTVTCSVSDASSNNASCTFTVTVNDTQNPTISCPANLTQNTDAGVCTAVVTFATPAGSDNCPGVSVACSPASGATFNKGVTTVTCTATDTSSHTAQCQFSVTVNDTQAPTVTCPANITQATANGQCTAAVTYTTPTASDNCVGVGAVTCTPASGATFNKGTTTVTCAVSDAAGNNANCSFTIMVNDNQPPTLTCPANQTRLTDANQCAAVVTYATPAVNDNCTGASVSCSPSSGSSFPKGTTTVNCTATDASGNTASCAFTVTVNDAQAPIIVCPANVVATTPIGSATCTVVNFTTPVASDNCPGVTVLCSPASGSCFPIGTTAVSCTATDASGNRASCAFTVKVYDICLQDDSNATTVMLINSLTGEYRFCCNGQTLTGSGTVTKKGNVVTVEHNTATRRVYGKVDKSANSGTGWVQQPVGVNWCSITDRDIRNNSCACAVGG
ncbi:MAG: HYR domain-containing protein [Acidobacteria bacterium]|nr:HYR domain-containing protein [Acidobacteriota bacterium]